MILSLALTHQRPFPVAPFEQFAAKQAGPPPPPSRSAPGVPAWLDDLVGRLLAPEPDDRPAGAAEVARRLASCGAD